MQWINKTDTKHPQNKPSHFETQDKRLRYLFNDLNKSIKFQAFAETTEINAAYFITQTEYFEERNE